MALDLKKKAELVGLRLKKLDIEEDTVCRVVMVTDGSYSMKNLFRDGTVQELTDRCLGVANRFDDNQSLEQYIFSDEVEKLDDATPAEFGTYVRDTLLPSCPWGGTVYSNAVRAVTKSYDTEIEVHLVDVPGEDKRGFLGKFLRKPVPTEKRPVVTEKKIQPEHPMFVIFQTDGDNNSDDVNRFFMALQESVNKRIFWMFLGVGHSSFGNLRIAQARYPNCDFVRAEDLSKISDEELYDALLSKKFATWLKAEVKAL